MLTIKQALALYPHYSGTQIAALTGRKIQSVYKTRHRMKYPDRWAAERRARYEAAARQNGVRPMSGIIWPKEHVDLLRKLWMTTSAREIGLKIGRSKSAVIGMAHRLELPFKGYVGGTDKAWKQYQRDMKQIEARNG